MSGKRVKLLVCTSVFIAGSNAFMHYAQGPASKIQAALAIPRTWDDDSVASLQVPLADPAYSPVHVSSQYYYDIPVRPIYKSFPIYAPHREPVGYMQWLKEQEPEVAFDTSTLKTETDWIKAGEVVFEAPITHEEALGPLRMSNVLDPAWYEKTNMPLEVSGALPFARYVIRLKGKIEVGNLSCAMCHVRVMPDGTSIKGAQGNFPFDRVIAFNLRERTAQAKDKQQRLGQIRLSRRFLFGSPWLKPDPQAQIEEMSAEEIASAHEAIPPGVIARHGTSPFSPAQVPDLIGVRERQYLDQTGLVRHRTIADLMRYAALNQDMDALARYGDFVPARVFEDLRFGGLERGRYSDEQLYALSLYLYSIKPPPNPNKLDALAASGRAVFQRQGCGVCHTPPLYTNNRLTPAEGFTVPEDHSHRYDVLPIYVGTDPKLALKTRRGTGYYKVPSLKGLWYRGPLEHSGSIANLEDWFDPRRTLEGYVPSGFRGQGVTAKPVKGHAFGLGLSTKDREALIAFLRTL